MTDIPRSLPRRAVLAASGTAVLAAAAACSTATSASDPPASTASPAATSSSPATASSTTSAGPSATSAATSAATSSSADAGVPSDPPGEATPAEQAPAGTPVASVADVQAAGSIVVGENQDAYLLAYTDGTVVAHTAVCTHQQCTVGGSGLCPCHQSRFDVRTGAVINGPALRPLTARTVTVSGGQVYLT